jgi:hypothetical protein
VVTIEALRLRASESPQGCWEWTGCIQANGYGRVRAERKTMYAHRAAYEAANGPIPRGQDVCHRCDNRRCINPAHLFLGTRKDNMRDAVQKGRVASGPEHAARLAGEKGPGHKLTAQQVAAIREALKHGAKTASLAQIALVTPDTIRQIRAGRTWKEKFPCVV